MQVDNELSSLIEREFVCKDNIEESLNRFVEVIKTGIDFKARDKVVNHLTIDKLKNIIYEDVPAGSTDFYSVLGEFKDKIANHSTNFGSPNFMAFPDSGNAISSISGAILMNFLNQNLINSKHCAPAASVVEMTVISWLRKLIGYDVIEKTKDIFDVGGIVVSGGVLANTIAMLLAREKLFPGTKDNGINFDTSKVKVIIPEYIDHYSIRTSLGWLGLGEGNLIRVKAGNFKIDVEDLVKIIEDHKHEYKFMAIVAYAGDSRSMTIDNFDDVYAVAKNYDIWLHVDACHGFQYAFSKNLREKLGSINLADSITVDPHKILFLPYNMSAVLVKDHHNFRRIAGSSDLITKEDHAFGQITPFIGSKGFWSLKLWFMWKTIGTANIGKLIEYRHNLAKYLCDKLEQDKDFCVINKEVNINSVIFMYVPTGYSITDFDTEEKIEKLNMLNKELQDRLFCGGDFYVHTFTIPDLGGVINNKKLMLQPLRYMCGNPVTKTKNIDNMVEEVRRIGKEIEKMFV